MMNSTGIEQRIFLLHSALYVAIIIIKKNPYWRFIMSANGRFKKSLFGFRKSSVLNYIEEYQAEFSSKAEEDEKKIRELTDRLACIEEQYKQAVEINTALEDKLSECENAITELSATAGELQAELDKNKNLHEKIGNVYVEAKADAKQIVDKASDNARSIIKTADRSAGFTASQIESTVDDLTSIRSDLERSVRSFNDRIKQINLTLSDVKAQLSDHKARNPVTDDELAAMGILPISK